MYEVLFLSLLVIIIVILYEYKQYRKYLIKIEIARKEKKEREYLEAKKLKYEKKIADEGKRQKLINDNKEYQLNTHKVKYNLYDNFHFSFSTKKIYNAFIEDELWIQEPFYTTFFNILQMIDSDNMMIRDFNSDVMILNIRDENGEDTISESFEVISSKEYIVNTIIYCEKAIKKFNKNDAQLIILAISMIILKKSMHFQHDSLDNIINQIFSDKNYFEKIQEIINLIESNNEQLSFINKALDSVFKDLKRYPYNTTEKLNRVVIPNLSQKTLLPL